jgi:hypothetical protein
VFCLWLQAIIYLENLCAWESLIIK